MDKLVTPSTADIRLTVVADTVGIADTIRLVAAVTADGKRNAALRVEWSTSNAAVATVDSSGLVRGLLRDTATITARVENELFLPAPLEASAVVRVVVPALELVADSSVLRSVGDTVCVTPTARDAQGVDLGLAPDSLLYPDSVFVPEGATGAAQCFRATRASGRVAFRSWIDLVQATESVSVTPVAASLSIAPDSLHFNSLTDEAALAAAATDRRGNPIESPAIAWTSCSPAVATVDAVTALVTAVGNGATCVVGASGTARDTIRVVVQQVAKDIGVLPATETLRTVRGRSTLRATVRDSLGQQIQGAAPAWSSLHLDSVAVVYQSGDSAIVEAVAEGAATITAQQTVGGQVLTGAARVTVRYELVSLTVSPPAATLLAIDDTVRFAAAGRDANDSVVSQPRVAWRAADTTRVRIDSLTGLATARGAGTTSVTAQRDAVADTAAASVTPPVLVVDDASVFSDSALRSSADTVSTTRVIGNGGTGTLGVRLSIVRGASWLRVEPDTITVDSAGQISIRLKATAGSLVEGLYRDTVRLRSVGAAGSPRDIPVRFTVYCPIDAISPDTALAAELAATDCGARHQAGSFADYYAFSGTGGDTIRVAMTTSPTSLDTYLYLLDGAGSVVASNDNCPGLGLNSCLQVVVPASGQYTIEATSFTAGAAFAYTLALTHPLSPAAATTLAQRAEGAPLAAGDSANTGTIEFRASGQDPNLRDSLRLEVEVKGFGASFTGTQTITGSPVPNAGGGVTLSATVSGLKHDSSYHWRARVVDQTNRAGPWTPFGTGSSPDFTVFITSPVLTVDPTVVTDSALFGSTMLRETGIAITNTGTGTFTWTATVDSTWVGLSPGSGAPGEPLTVSLDPADNPPGTYRATVTVTTAPAAIGSPATIAVTLVIQQPVLVVTPAAVADSTNAGSGQSFLKVLRVSNGGTGSLSWTAAHNPADTWLTLARTAGGAPDSVPLTINSAGLAAGTYRDTVVVTAAGATSSPDSIPITLTVHQPLLAVAPTPVRDSANFGSSVARTHTLRVTNADGGTLTWSATKIAAWLELSKSSGGAPDSLVLTLRPDTLAGVVHEDTIVFISPEANNDPIKVPIVFEILQPALSVTPGAIADSAVQFETTPRAHTLTIANAGRGTLAWTAAGDTTWIGVAPASADTAAALTVTLDPSGLITGTHSGRVIVAAANATGSPDTIPVTFTITPPPVLALAPTAYSDSAFQGSALAKSVTVHITNTGPGGSLAWSAVDDAPWLALSSSGGGTPDSTLVTLTPGALGVGTHSGAITVTAPGAAGSPATVPVTFTIRPCLEPAVVPDTVIAGVVTRSDCGAPLRTGSLAKLYSVTANAGDTLSFRLSADFDAYLVLTDSFGTSLRQNDDCPPQTGPACILNYPVTVTGRYIIEATTKTAGDTGAFSLSAVRERAPSLPQSIGQFQGDSTTAIGIGLTTPENVAVFKGTLLDPNPGDSVRLQIELVLASSPFSDTLTHQSGFVAAGGTAAIRVTGLAENAEYHWQARTCDKTLRCGGWLDFGGNALTAADFFVNALPENPSVPTGIGQFESDGNTPIGVGGGSGGSSVVLKGTVSDPDPGDQVRLEVEVREVPLLGNNFTDAATGASALGASGRVAAATGPATLLLSYHWQVRACDQTGRCSAWVSFPQPTPNAETSADYVGSL